jgi:hypothetical protein
MVIIVTARRNSRNSESIRVKADNSPMLSVGDPAVIGPDQQ